MLDSACPRTGVKALMTAIGGHPRKLFGDGRRAVLEETDRLLKSVPGVDWGPAGQLITSARRIFVIGNGRSGLTIQMAAMRLMHLGLRVHMAGEVTAPALGEGDLLIAVSGSGTTESVIAAARTAKKVGATVLAVTTAPNSALSQQSDAGSLFEKSVLLAFDALFQSLWSNDDQSAEKLWKRHANIC